MNAAGAIPYPLPCGESSSEQSLLNAGTATQRRPGAIGGRCGQDMTYSGLQSQGRGEDVTFSAAYLNTMGPRGYSSSTPFDNNPELYGFKMDHSWVPDDFPFDADYVDLVQCENLRSSVDMAVYGCNKYGLTAGDVMRQSNTLDRNDCSALTGLLSLILSCAVTQRQEDTCLGCEVELKEEFELGPVVLETGDQQSHTCGDEIPPNFFADKANYFYVKHILHTRLLGLAIAHVLGDVFPSGEERRLGMVDCIFENFCAEENTGSALTRMGAHIPPQDRPRFDKAFSIWQSGTCRARSRCC